MTEIELVDYKFKNAAEPGEFRTDGAGMIVIVIIQGYKEEGNLNCINLNIDDGIRLFETLYYKPVSPEQIARDYPYILPAKITIGRI